MDRLSLLGRWMWTGCGVGEKEIGSGGAWVRDGCSMMNAAPPVKETAPVVPLPWGCRCGGRKKECAGTTKEMESCGFAV